MRRPLSARNRALAIKALLMLVLIAIAAVALVSIGFRTRDVGVGLAVLAGGLLGWLLRGLISRGRGKREASRE